MAPVPGSTVGKVTMPRIGRMVTFRERGLSWRAIGAAMDVYEGNAPCNETIRKYVLAAGCPKKPRGRSF